MSPPGTATPVLTAVEYTTGFSDGVLMHRSVTRGLAGRAEFVAAVAYHASPAAALVAVAGQVEVDAGGGSMGVGSSDHQIVLGWRAIHGKTMTCDT